MRKFDIGQLVTSAAVSSFIEEDNLFLCFVADSLKKYVKGDWGDTCSDDAESNELALNPDEPERIFAVYKHPEHEDWTIWIITERDRRATTVLFPSDY